MVLGGGHRAHRSFQFNAVEGHIPPTPYASDTDLTAYAQNREPFVSARVGLFELQRITHVHFDDWHKGSPFALRMRRDFSKNTSYYYTISFPFCKRFDLIFIDCLPIPLKIPPAWREGEGFIFERRCSDRPPTL